jgi:hypothetical protein
MNFAGKLAVVITTAGVCLVCLASLPAQARDPLTVEKYVQYFDEIVFRSEYASARPSFILRKWPGPVIKFKIGGLKKPAEKYRKVIARHSKALSRYGAPKFVEIGGKTPGEDIIFMFARTNSMKKAGRLLEKDETVLRDMAKGSCYFLSYHMPDGKLVKAMIVVNAEFPDVVIRHCLLEEMAQTLGLPNDSRYVSPSLFNDHEQRQDLSQIDKVLVRTLYDKRMKAGMPREAALKMAHRVISRLMGKAARK